MTDYIQAWIDRALRAEAAMEANIATLELCQEAVVELERKLYLAGTDLIEVRDQRDAARTERNALRAENERLRDGLEGASGLAHEGHARSILMDHLDRTLAGHITDHAWVGIKDHPDDPECSICQEPEWLHEEADR